MEADEALRWQRAGEYLRAYRASLPKKKVSRTQVEGDCAQRLLLLISSNPSLFELDGLVPITEEVKGKLVELIAAKIEEESHE